MAPWWFELSGSAACWTAIKAAALLGVIALAIPALGRYVSAATRHFAWALALGLVLLLPAATFVLPQWPLEIAALPAEHARTPIQATRQEAVSSIPAQAASSPASATAILERHSLPQVSRPGTMALAWMIYAFGLLAVLSHVMAEQWRVRRLARAATPVVDDAAWTPLLAECARLVGSPGRVRFFRSRELNVPVAFGIRRPSIMIPAVADTWEDDRRRAVLLHELAHVCRRDCLTQALAWTACAIYWFNPLAWWAARQLRLERELACDDRVIAAGTAPRDYAGHLLEIAYSLGGHRAPALSVGMARRGQLEGRMLAALDERRRRQHPSRRFRAASVVLTALLVGPISGVSPVIVERGDDRSDGPPPLAQHAAIPGVVAPTLKSAPWKNAVDRFLEAAMAISAAQPEGPGTWEVRPTGTPGVVHLRLMEPHSSSGTNVPLTELEGLTAAQLTGTGGPVRFKVRRDAGTFTFEGVVGGGVGAGTFSFAADPGFPTELQKRGFDRPTAGEQYQLARHDVGYAFLDELKAQGYAAKTADLVRAGQHGVSTTYLREMGSLGYRLGALDALITLRDHGVTPEYTRELAELGYKGLDADALRRARDHGVTPDYVRGMRDAGSGTLSMDQLIMTRDHGVTPDYARALAEAGYRNVAVDKLVEVRDHGVTAEYVRDMKQLGFALSLDELVGARDHGVTVEYTRAMKALGYDRETVASLVRMRDHGVTPDYAKQVQGLGYDRLPAGDLIVLRDHGLTPDRIRQANGQKGTRLSVAELTAWASRGMR